MTRPTADLDRGELVVLLARLGAELTNDARTARRIESVITDQPTIARLDEVQMLDALTQNLEQIGAFVLRLSAAVDDGAPLDAEDISRLVRPVLLKGLATRLMGRVDPSGGAVAGEVEIW